MALCEISDPSKVYVTKPWVSGSMLLYLKTPTVALFKENKEFHSVGYEAEDAYSELVFNGEHKPYYFFKRFKMRLHGKKVCTSS